jgi:hypothetical protein
MVAEALTHEEEATVPPSIFKYPSKGKFASCEPVLPWGEGLAV